MLLNQYGQQLTPKRDGIPDYREIATIDGGRDITRTWLTPLLQTQDEILLGRGQGNLKFYEDIFRDGQAYACVRNFVAGVISRSWKVRPGKARFREENDADKRAADFTKEALESLPWDTITAKMMLGNWYGYAVGENMWTRDGNWVTWDDRRRGIRIRKARRFGFDQQQRLRLLTWTDQWQGEPLQADKFWVHSCGADNDDEPHGQGWAKYCTWPILFKRYGYQYWLKFLEVCGVPARIGEYPQGTPKNEQDKLLRAAQEIGSASATVIPQGMILRLLERTGAGMPDNASLVGECNDEIAKIILGQTLTTEAVGGQYKADVQMTVRDQLIRTASDELSHSFSYGPLSTLMRYNASLLGDAAVPIIERDFEQEPDKNKLAEVYKTLDEIGWEADEDTIQDDFGDGFTKKVAPPPPTPIQLKAAGKPPAALPQVKEFSQAVLAEEADVVGKWAAQAAEDYSKAMRPVYDKIREMVFADDIEDLEELQRRIFALFPELPIGQAGAILGDLLQASELAGRYEVQEGA